MPIDHFRWANLTTRRTDVQKDGRTENSAATYGEGRLCGFGGQMGACQEEAPAVENYRSAGARGRDARLSLYMNERAVRQPPP